MNEFARQLSIVRDRLFPRRMCAKKVRYLSAGAAHLIRKRRQPKEKATLFVYRCPECDGYHLTKMKPPPEYTA